MLYKILYKQSRQEIRLEYDGASVEHEIVARRDRLVARRTDLLHQRARIFSELRLVDRELSDCAAAARFFRLSIEFPPDEREEYERIRAKQRERELQEREIARAKAINDSAGQATLLLHQPIQSAAPEATVSQLSSLASPARPKMTVREIVLKFLAGSGSTGMRAETIREFLDRHHGMSVHEKTVGMTLYRLSKENLVHRIGHTWFSGPPSTATENPGADTPGGIFD